MTKNALTFPLYTLNVNPAKSSFFKVSKAIDTHDFDRAIDLATSTIDHIEQSLLFNVLDHRAYSLAINAKFVMATKDIHRMIEIKPTSPIGYRRLGDIYAIQGKQVHAINAFELGLQRASQEDPEYARLLDCKYMAIQQSQKRVDFIAKLPLEVLEIIVKLLSKEIKLTCFTVSNTWCKRVVECSPASWQVLTNEDDYQEEEQLINVIPRIATYIKDLTINTKNQRVRLKCLHTMRKGRFKNIRSLYLTGKKKVNVEKGALV
ncbi:hypothetical protein BDA99DRAFT_266569 [Phascolomyces articulosus]|uniref:F-box domain-containing protein n=1 Tax=Phascolomyces articulosus TaxID=60185 RepID=A0AAD5JX92_9FUNG|nr:hypothetical protein BDA99DRAFT_266569 [Phascolomyces articulosus]